ncbi:MAG TPA: SRPBCC domain-containing protein [Candidatus Dormibacteraeota bacterium]|nr:SRPBCC domain-containing protein [Candidatus Dormibacteraeota bacterium]
MAQPEQAEVVRVVRIQARPDIVFSFFTDPERMARWKGRSAVLDPRPGGIYQVDIHGNMVRGEYVAIEPYTRVVFTWGWEGEGPVQPGTSTVEVLLRPDGDGTVLTLRHGDLPDAAAAAEHAAGWDHFLPRLAATAEGRDPGPDPWAQPQQTPGDTRHG